MPTPSRPAVLVVEDERIFAIDLQQSLNELGYDAFAVASSAEEALAHASQRRPDLVLMDIRIKGERDGIEAAALLKERFDVPVVFLTALADEATIARAKLTEPQGYLLKPVRDAELRSIVEVTLHKHDAEKQLRQRERWFSTTLRSIADAIIAVDPKGHVTFMNAQAESLTGARLADVAGKPIDDVLRLADRSSDEESPLIAALRTGAAVELPEARVVNNLDGTTRIISDSAAPVVDGERLLGAVMVFRDVTERRRTERKLELADRMASLGMMAAGVAHEVNNPLAVVVANASFLEEDLREIRERSDTAEDVARLERMERVLGDVRTAAIRIRNIVSELRSLSRPREQESRAVDLNHCIEWAVRSTEHELRPRAKLVVQLGTVPPVIGDETRLGQVFVNLIVNAAQAIPPGGAEKNQVTVTTSVSPEGLVVAEVTDTGVGIPESDLPQVFEPFFTTKGASGTGLGLSICHGIVTALGGSIRVDSAVGVGTTVRVELPAASAAKARSARPSSRRRVVRGRVLIIDDEPLLLGAMKLVLTDHEVTCVDRAADALALLARGQSFDVILTDVTMPVMTGIELYEKLAAEHPALVARVVFLTGGALSPQADAFLRALPNRRFEKPFEVDELLDAVQEIILKTTSD